MVAGKKKQSFTKVTSPKGTALWAYITKPDEFNGAEKWKCNVVLPEDEAQDFLEKLKKEAQEAFDKYYAKARPAAKKKMELHVPYEEEYNEDGEPTGNIIIKAQANTGYKDARGNWHDIKIDVFDAKGRKIENPPLVGNGSTIRMAGYLKPFHMEALHKAGVTWKLTAVQIIDLVEFGAGAEAYGFAEEEGFDASSTASQPEEVDSDDMNPDDIPF